MDYLLEFKEIRDKSQSLSTILVWDYEKKELESYIKKRLELIKSIKDTVKRKIINDRLYNFLTHIEKDESKLNKIYLVGETVECINLTKENINVLKKYNKGNFYYICDDHYKIDYLYNLFTDFTFYKIGELNNKKLIIEEINLSKRLELESKNISNQTELIDYAKNLDLLHGVSGLLKNLKTDTINFNNKLNHYEILDEIDKIKMLESHKKLQELIDNILNPKYDGKIFFGENECKKYFEMYAIKTLFIHESKYEDFVNDNEINFEIIKIGKIKNGDVSNTLVDSYDNFIGELYYAM